MEGPLADLERVEAIVRAHLSEHVYYEKLLCHVFGGRGEVFREWGVLDRAGLWFAREREAVAALVERGEACEKERLAANAHEVNQALALDDADLLESSVRRALDDTELYDAFPLERVKLRLRLGRGLFEAERLDRDRPRRAESILSSALAELEQLAGSPEAMPTEECLGPALTLAEIALREGDERTARLRLAEVKRIASRLSGPHPEERALVAALASRIEGNPARTLPALAKAYGALVASWKAAAPRAGGYGFLEFGAGRAVLSELIRAEMASRPGESGVRRAFEHALACQDLGSLARRLEGGAVDLARLRAEFLKPGDGLALLVPARDASHLFLCDTERIDHIELAPIDVLRARLGDLLRTLQGPLAELPAGRRRERRAERREAARSELGRLLLPPRVVERLGRWTLVTVVGLDLVGEVPLELLPAGDHPFLGTWRAVARLPNLSVGLALARRSGEPGRTGMALFAAPENPVVGERFGVDPADLALPAESFEAFLAPYSSGVRVLWRGREATLERLDDPALDRVGALQFFTHGVQELDRERPAALVLTPSAAHPDGLLRAVDIEARRMPPLVIASACRTGAGPSRRGDAGASDLGGAFLGSGARAVLLSPFDLELTAARRLAEGFHGAWAGGGVGAAEALRAAREELSRDPDFDDPFLFGLFWCVGDGNVQGPKGER